MSKGIKSLLPNKNDPYDNGVYVVKNKNKYAGDTKRVFYRSSLEKRFFAECDNDPNVVKWEAEPPRFSIKYFSPVDSNEHTYYPDVYVEKIIKGGLFKFLVEIKPSSMLKKPEKPKVLTINSKRAWKRRMDKYAIIDAKRKAAQTYATKKNMVYIFLTEKYINKGLF